MKSNPDQLIPTKRLDLETNNQSSMLLQSKRQLAKTINYFLKFMIIGLACRMVVNK